MTKPNSIIDRFRQWRSGDSGAQPPHPVDASDSAVTVISQAKQRQIVELRGAIRGLETKPRQGIPWLEADFSDGTGNIKLVWMGRQQIPGIKTGRKLKVSGRLAAAGGQCLLYNPRYELLED
ncbi:MAG: OB-fold nucleic acid binding domain-containing protein [Propionibacteriaceae bacterium]|jgi:RecG-like helicase|nr:OB-fold nucleic acid binding domain-containing protein [Propionibacteriaceae bacterium]